MVKIKFKQTDIGLIPEDWEILKFLDFSDKSKKWSITGGPFGSNLKTSDYTNRGVQIIQLQNIGDGNFINNSQVYTSEQKADELISCNIYPGEIILSKMGDPVTRACIIPSHSKRFLMASDGIRLVVDEKVFDKKFVFQYINSAYFRNRAIDISTGTTRQRIGLPELKSLDVVCPPLPEQTRIAQALSDTDAWIESLEKLINKKRLIKQGAMQELLTPKEDWKELLLGDVANIIGGGTPSTKNPYFWNGTIEWFTPTEVGDSKYLKSSLRKLTEVGLSNCSARILPAGSILLTTRAGIGDLGILTKPASTNQGFQSLVPLDKISGEFLYYLTSTLKNTLLQNASGSTFLEISPSKVKSIQISLPSPSEQTRIATILSDMDAEIEALENKLHKSKQLKQGMMQELLTGRIRLIKSVENKKIEPNPTKGHNDQFNDAVLIATMASVFGSDKFPLTRFKYTKVSYLLKRYKEEQDAGYLKHAAGPYKPKTRYGGAEKIAINKKYIDLVETNYKGKEYEGFVASKNVDEAIKYFEDWYNTDALKWIEQFKFEKNDNLELWATVDMAIEDLKKKNEIITVGTIKQVLKENKEWKDKLKRSIFSDINIQKAIIKLETLFT